MRSGAAWTVVRSSWFSQNLSEAHFREPRARILTGCARLTTISTPHGLAFRDALRGDPDQHQRSACFEA